jgi:hypothetical protein
MRTLRRQLSREARSPALTRSFLLALVSSSAVLELALPHLEAAQRVSAELFKLGQKRGEIRSDRPAAEIARAMRDLAFGTALFWLGRPDTSLRQLLDANFEMVCRPPDAVPKRPSRRRDATRSPRSYPRRARRPIAKRRG